MWSAALSALALIPTRPYAQQARLPTRTIPGTTETLPIMGLGLEKAVNQRPGPAHRSTKGTQGEENGTFKGPITIRLTRR